MTNKRTVITIANGPKFSRTVSKMTWYRLGNCLQTKNVSPFPCFFKARSKLRQRNLKTEVSLWKCIKCFPPTARRRNLKTHAQSTVILDLCLRKKRDVVVFESFVFKKSNLSGLKSVFEKLRLRGGLVWTVGLTVEIKLCFQIPPAYCGR